ncbi:hypothetical protein ZIOFF_032576 [Zingiber officinale]|uniref:U6 snRNA-associated Sm-like protein LSm4 n=1 Tax=Zingiber officinale TaxID=94328 RepID=A0A8J5GVN0_ZINOF|nr:hypothetical protein ZIOFF_032576 [Zingiber officinale]
MFAVQKTRFFGPLCVNHTSPASLIASEDRSRSSHGRQSSLCTLVELKNGETYNGHLVNCDTWMNIHLREVICTSKTGSFMSLIGCDSGCRMVTDFGGCLSVTFVGIPSSTFEFQMRVGSICLQHSKVIDKVQEETTKSRTEMAYIGKPMKVTANARNSCNIGSLLELVVEGDEEARKMALGDLPKGSVAAKMIQAAKVVVAAGVESAVKLVVPEVQGAAMADTLKLKATSCLNCFKIS